MKIKIPCIGVKIENRIKKISEIIGKGNKNIKYPKIQDNPMDTKIDK